MLQATVVTRSSANIEVLFYRLMKNDAQKLMVVCVSNQHQFCLSKYTRTMLYLVGCGDGVFLGCFLLVISPMKVVTCISWSVCAELRGPKYTIFCIASMICLVHRVNRWER